MAEMLRDDDSTRRHLSATRRHVRRCKAVAGAAWLRDQIVAPRDALAAAEKKTEAAAEAVEDARNDLELLGKGGADALRTASEDAKHHDRAHPGEGVHERAFPEGGFGELLASDGGASEAALLTVAKRIEELGAEHALAGLAVDLRARAGAIEGGELAVTDAVRQKKLAETDEEIAQAKLRKQYEDNYLDARKKLGRAFADRLFPRIRRRTPASEGAGEPTPSSGEA